PVAQPQTQAAGLTPRLVGDAGDRRQRDHALAQSPSQRVDLAIAAWNDAHQLTVERPTAVAHDDLGHSRIVVIAAGNMTGHPKLGCCRWAIFTPHAPAFRSGYESGHCSQFRAGLAVRPARWVVRGDGERFGLAARPPTPPDGAARHTR